MQQVKVPKEVMELVYEAQACEALAQHYRDSWFSFPKAIYYATKQYKARNLAMRALGMAHPAALEGDWTIDVTQGIAHKTVEPKPEVAKKPRKKREPKSTTAVPAEKATEGAHE